MKGDQGYEDVEINKSFINILKNRQMRHVYLETDLDRLQFSNSCWEIQRVNPLKGGNIILGEPYRLRHISTGKYLSVGDDR